MENQNNKKEVNIVREFDASPETVWQAWIDPELLKQWWGPNNVTIPECEVDLKIGGKFYIVMEAGVGMGPYKGTKWPMLAEFTEIVPSSKLSYRAQAWVEGAKEKTTIDQTTDVKFTEENGKTKLEIKATIHKAGPEAGMAVQGMQAGFTQQLEKLDNFLSPKSLKK